MSNAIGHIYRVASANRTQLHALIKTHVGDQGWTFGGAAQWDFVSNKGQQNLREVASFADADLVDIEGDFGHAFSVKAEVRWKRRDDGHYDVLVLSEDPQTVQAGAPLRVPRWNSATQNWEGGDWQTYRPEVATIRQTAERSPISYIDYLAPNGAVQFQRLRKVEP